jgi:DnaJ-class molecular chaperone
MSTPRPDHYATLGLTPQASPDQIRHAFRDLMHRNHPDTRQPEPAEPSRGDDSNALLQQVIAAYAVLGDPQRRADYDAAATRHAEAPISEPRPFRPRSYSGEPPIRVGPVRWHRRST